MTPRHAIIMREFFDGLIKDPWIEGRIKTHAREALKHWDDVLYHGRDHERSVSFQEAADPGTGD